METILSKNDKIKIWYQCFLKREMATPNTINFCNLTGPLLELVLTNIAKCLTVAGLSGGRVFGGFVRDVVVPRMIDPQCEVKFSDVDIWFINKSAASTFVAAMGQDLREPPFGSYGGNGLYQFDRTKYNLYCGDICVAYIDVVVSDVLPVNDFDIHRYAVQYFNNMPLTAGLSGLVEYHKLKVADMLPYYFDLLHNPSTHNMHYARVRKLLNKGWKISLRGDRSPISQDNANGSSEFFTREWLLKWSQEKQPSTTIKPNNQVTITSDQNLSEVRTLCRNSIVSLNTLMDKLKSMNL